MLIRNISLGRVYPLFLFLAHTIQVSYETASTISAWRCERRSTSDSSLDTAIG